MCEHHPLLPTGQSDLPNVKTVKLYCGKCEDIYNPKSTRHASIDGAYFGTSFHNILFQVYPALIPEKSIRRYEPRIYGFKVHACAALARWQDGRREDMKERLAIAGIDAGFIEDSEREDEDEVAEEDDKSLVTEPVEGSAVAGVVAKSTTRTTVDSARMDVGT
jgi:casein kinase II subunit beta